MKTLFVLVMVVSARVVEQKPVSGRTVLLEDIKKLKLGREIV